MENKLEITLFSILVPNQNPMHNPACQKYDRRDRYEIHYCKKMTGR